MEIYDCILREGEQHKGAAFSLDDRLKMCHLLDELGVNYIELGWPIASQDIFDSFTPAMQAVKKARIVAFGSTSLCEYPENDKNLRSIVETGVKYACIFGKTDLDHVEKQLGINGKDNLEKIRRSVEFLRKNGIVVFYDAEHFFDGFKKNRDYALDCLESAFLGGAERLVLCDTNGGMIPEQVREILRYTRTELDKRKVKAHLGVHFHDDCNLALANTLESLPYIEQVQGTINGLGERIGNLNLTTFIAVYTDKLGKSLVVNLSRLKEVNEESFRLCGVGLIERRPYVGDNAFAHRGGVHVDATRKGASYEHTNPEKFGNKRVVILNSLGGASSVIEVAKQFGINLIKGQDGFDEKVKRLMEELRTYERAGYDIGAIRSEQFLLLNKYFGNHSDLFEIKSWNSESARRVTGQERAKFYGLLEVKGKLVDRELSVDGGPIDAAFNTLKTILIQYYPRLKDLHLHDFTVRIAREGEEKSSVRNEIWFKNGEEFSTVGVDSNIIGSGVEAIAKGFRYHLLR